jgi:hypothetical protein
VEEPLERRQLVIAITHPSIIEQTFAARGRRATTTLAIPTARLKEPV